MTVHLYSSSDVDAPALRGNTPGDVINLLTKCLVDGYGSQPGAGWTRPFIGTNVAAFKTGAGSNGMYLRVDDTMVASGTANRGARVVGFEAMSDVNTGTGQFPTSTQESGGLYWWNQYSGSTVADARSWYLVADEAFMVLWIKTYPQQSNTYFNEAYWFGDIVATGPADSYATAICGKRYNSSPNSSDIVPFASVDIGSASSGCYMPRSYTGLGGSIAVGHSHDARKSGTNTWGGTGPLQYPHGPDGALLMSPVWVHEPGSTNAANIRGTLPGVWAPLQYVLNTGDTFAGQGDLAGKNFLAIRQYESRAVLEISDTWR